MKTPMNPDAVLPGTAYLVALLVVVFLDAVWLGWFAKDYYRSAIGALMSDSIRLAPAAAFYLLYPLGLVFLALRPIPATFSDAFVRSAVVGVLAYGTYDLTNFATLRGWSWQVSVIDVAWGTVVSATAGTAAWWFVLRDRVVAG